MLDKVLARLDSDFDQSLERLFALIRFQSISTDPVYGQECRRAADWLVEDLRSLGMQASRRDTPGHPMVVAHHEGPGDDAPHILFYGHYDVQPVDPLELWHDDPFTPQIKEQNGTKIITGRGSSDDKGQLMTFVEALRAFKTETGTLPVRLTLLFEGEEESGSTSLKPFLQAHARELKADFAFVCDTSMWNAQTPSISASLRGLLGQEIVIHAANRDLHSGSYGGVAANPITILSQILASLHDESGRVTIPGFYDGVEETPSQILASWNNLGLSAQEFLEPIGLSQPSGEKDRTLLELLWARPTAEINGIGGGYQGDGFKTVIASQASAKISFRLVHKQDPIKIRSSFQEFVRAQLPADCRVEFINHGCSGGIQLDTSSHLIDVARAALCDEWLKPAVLVGMGGSIPIVGDFQSILGMESILIGFALEDDCIHSPNEKYNLQSFHKGQRSWARILDAIAKQGKGA